MNISRDVCRSAVLTLSAGAMLLMPSGHAWQQAQPMGSMPGMSGKTTVVDGHACDDMGSNTHGMSVMGQSMAAMTNHMCITPLRPPQPGDVERVEAMLAQIRAAIDKYKDYKKALADGYVIGNPKVEQPQ